MRSANGLPKVECEIQTQVLLVKWELPGTPFSLHYRSDRVPGRLSAYNLRVPLSGASLSPGLKKIELEVETCGRYLRETFPPAPNQEHTVTLSQLSLSQHDIQGSQAAKIRVRYVCRGTYPRPEVIRRREWNVPLGPWDAREIALAGWMFDVHHRFDASTGTLYLGDGRRRTRPFVYPVSKPEILVASEDENEFYIFNREGRHLRTVNLMGSVQSGFGYDSAGRLTSIQDACGNVTRVERSADGLPTGIVDSYGHRIGVAADSQGFLSVIKNPANEVIKFGYSSSGLLTSVTDPSKSTYNHTYDHDGALIQSEDPAGGGYRLLSNQTESSSTVALITAMDRESTYSTERLSNGAIRLVNKCCGGRRIIVVDSPESRTVTYPSGTVLWQETSGNGDKRLARRTASVRTPTGLRSAHSIEHRTRLTRRNNPLSVLGRQDSVTMNGQKYTRAVDVSRKQLTMTSPLQRKVTFRVNDRGQLVELTVPNLHPMTLEYDQQGRLAALKQGSDREARVMNFRHDDDGQRASIADSLGREWHYEYDRASRVSKQVLPDGRQIEFAHDVNGNLTGITPPGRLQHCFQYSPLNQLAAYLPPAKGPGRNDTGYIYNLDKQLTRIDRSDGTSIDLAYVQAGYLEHLTFPSGEVRLKYQPQSKNLVAIDGPQETSLVHEYDGDLLTKVRWDGSVRGTVTQTFDTDMRVVSRSINGDLPISFEYDPDGALVKAGHLAITRDPESGQILGTKLGKVTTTHEYNGFGELKRCSAKFDDREIFATTYKYDSVGRIVELNETVESETKTYVYSYDVAGRLVGVKRNGIPTARYEYDSNGNRLKYEGEHGSGVASYDGQDRILQYGATSFTHNITGEWSAKMENGKATCYEYDPLGNLRHVRLPDGRNIDYVIDGAGRRIGRKVNGKVTQAFLYDGQLRPIAELDAGNNVVSRFIYGTKINVPEYLEKGGRRYRIITDHLGSPRLIVDVDGHTGDIAQRMDYDEFGNALVEVDPSFHPFGFAGGIYDHDTKLVRFGLRDYDPGTGRWTAEDPVRFAGGLNLYEYVRQNPVTYVDPVGVQGHHSAWTRSGTIWSGESWDPLPHGAHDLEADIVVVGTGIGIVAGGVILIGGAAGAGLIVGGVALLIGLGLLGLGVAMSGYGVNKGVVDTTGKDPLKSVTDWWHSKPTPCPEPDSQGSPGMGDVKYAESQPSIIPGPIRWVP